MQHLVKVGNNQPIDASSWWGRYTQSISPSLSVTSRTVLEADVRYIVENGIFGGQNPNEVEWPTSRIRSGLVMGAVQSGKTASMLGVTAMALDAGVDVVIILAGTRLSLWRQTFDRLTHQLSPQTADLILPSARAVAMPGMSPTDLYRDLSAARARQSIRRKTPIVMVTMKQVHHLHAAARALHERVFPELQKLDRAFHLLVLDDEADDGSILDAEVENSLDPSFDALKQIPRHVADLWSEREHPGITARQNLFATYVAYTATPQANLLQADENPLTPRDFLAALRTPGGVGGTSPRETTYTEPLGLPNYYTGGEVFYSRPSSATGFTVSEVSIPTSSSSDSQPATRIDWIRAAARAYLIGGAIRFWRDKNGPSLSGLSQQFFATEADARAASPPTHTMLLHPSPGVVDHFEALLDLASWGSRMPSNGQIDASALPDRLDSQLVAADVSANEPLWTVWLENYRASARAMVEDFGLESPPNMPGDEDWLEIRDILLNEVVPNVRLSVVNSDPNVDDRPDFSPTEEAAGSWRPPTDIFTIFVSGNVMARGLTLEGLATTLFLRSSSDPAADTQMQMQRWFGYRGKYLEICRVFAPEQQLGLLRQYHESDEALRLQIIEEMNNSEVSAPKPIVLEGARFKATGKIAAVSKVPLSPGASPFVDIVNDGQNPDPNVQVAVELFEEPSTEVVSGRTVRGRILDRTLSMTEAASVLDRLSYRDYSPDPGSPTSTRWTSLEYQLQMNKDLDQSLVPLFRPNQKSDSPMVISPRRCPFSIAAYLRLWEACLSRHARGLFPTDDGDKPWAVLDLADRRQNQPRFHVGIRYGSLPTDLAADDPAGNFSFAVPFVERTVIQGRITSRWGSRNPTEGEVGYAGDEFFDYYLHGRQVPARPASGPRWRPVGDPGLILLYLAKFEDAPYIAAAAGVCLPLGGPDHFASRPIS